MIYNKKQEIATLKEKLSDSLQRNDLPSLADKLNIYELSALGKILLKSPELNRRIFAATNLITDIDIQLENSKWKNRFTSLTNNCNLACDYCYAGKGKAVMSSETTEKAIEICADEKDNCGRKVRQLAIYLTSCYCRRNNTLIKLAKNHIRKIKEVGQPQN